MRTGLLILVPLAAGPVVAADPPSFVGTWSTTYGRMTLAEQNGTLSGNYGGRNGITGTEKDGKFTFTYIEPGVTGEGEFTLSADGQSFVGKWRAAGSAGWSDWTGRRVANAGPGNPNGQGGGGGGGGWGGPIPPPPGGRRQEEPEEPRPVVYRYGNLPPGLPDYFTKADDDRDGQIGLYEWAKYWAHGEAKVAEYKTLDLNGDGLLTAEEYLRWRKKNAPMNPGGGSQPLRATTPSER